jgi:hypothetical protein
MMNTDTPQLVVVPENGNSLPRHPLYDFMKRISAPHRDILL